MGGIIIVIGLLMLLFDAYFTVQVVRHPRSYKDVDTILIIGTVVFVAYMLLLVGMLYV